MQCTIYCHKRTGDCPNRAICSAYTQIAVADVLEQEGGKNSSEDGVPTALMAYFGFSFVANRPGPLIDRNLDNGDRVLKCSESSV